METREKLIELIEQKYYCSIEELADHLIANGVTLDNQVSKWIPVTERLPEKNGKYLCNYVFGDEYYMRFTQVLEFYATDRIPHFQHTLGEKNYMRVTHWMPLPQPPKGE